MQQRSIITDEVRRVEKEFKKYFYAVQSNDFFKYLLPIDQSIINDIQLKLEKTQYDGKCWKLISKAGGDERMLYKAFVEVANKINELVVRKRQAGAMEGIWVDCHHKSTISQDRPKVAFVSPHTERPDLQRYNDRMEYLQECLDGKRGSQDKSTVVQQVSKFVRFSIKPLIYNVFRRNWKRYEQFAR
jgi:hypothetical protein